MGALSLPLTVLAAVASWRLVERPVARRWGRRDLGASRTAQSRSVVDGPAVAAGAFAERTRQELRALGADVRSSGPVDGTTSLTAQEAAVEDLEA